MPRFTSIAALAVAMFLSQNLAAQVPLPPDRLSRHFEEATPEDDAQRSSQSQHALPAQRDSSLARESNGVRVANQEPYTGTSATGASSAGASADGYSSSSPGTSAPATTPRRQSATGGYSQPAEPSPGERSNYSGDRLDTRPENHTRPENNPPLENRAPLADHAQLRVRGGEGPAQESLREYDGPELDNPVRRAGYREAASGASRTNHAESGSSGVRATYYEGMSADATPAHGEESIQGDLNSFPYEEITDERTQAASRSNASRGDTLGESSGNTSGEMQEKTSDEDESSVNQAMGLPKFGEGSDHKVRSPGSLPSVGNPFSLGSSLVTIISSLAIVLGLFFLVMWMVKRGSPMATRALPREVLEVLGRTSLPGRQTLQMIRCGNKLLLVSISAAGAETLTEITDPQEVSRLAGLCYQTHGNSASSTFREALEHMATDRSNRHTVASSGAGQFPLGRGTSARTGRASREVTHG
jgi:flagellar biogenesis protein FliO